MEHDYIADAITEAYGERCPKFEPGCHLCEAWRQYDDLTDPATPSVHPELLKKAVQSAFDAYLGAAGQCAHEEGMEAGLRAYVSALPAQKQAAE